MREDLRQNMVLWRATQLVAFIAVFGPVCLFLGLAFADIGLLGAAASWVEYLALSVLLAWGVAGVVAVFLFSVWLIFVLMDRVIPGLITRRERQRLDGLVGDEASLPASAWGDEPPGSP